MKYIIWIFALLLLISCWGTKNEWVAQSIEEPKSIFKDVEVVEKNIEYESPIEIKRRDNDESKILEKEDETLSILWDIKICEKETDVYKRQQCIQDHYYDSAIKLRDEKICLSLWDMNDKQECSNVIYTLDAIEKKDINLCEKLKKVSKRNDNRVQNECISSYYINQAMELDDIKICNSIKIIEEKEKCINAFK